MFAVHNEESALDIVQDAMMKLAEKYGDRPAEELPMLFQRILQNTIRDYYRRSRVRSLWTTLLSSLSPSDDEDHDPLETISSEAGSYSPQTPHDQLQQSQVLAIIEKEIECCRPRQREAFLLRYWEDMDVADDGVSHGLLGGQRQDALLACQSHAGGSTESKRNYPMNELHFAYKLRQHLNRGLHELPSETVGRLEAARQRALAQQKVAMHQSVLAGAASFLQQQADNCA
jgi:RNA polymerase sigma-70 factor (ECF subfamily)